MSDSVNKRGEYDAVIGNKDVNMFGAVLGGIEGVKHRLLSQTVEHRVAALNEALKYEVEGLNLVIQALDDSEKLVRIRAYELLQFKEAPFIKDILEKISEKYYLVCFDGVYQCDHCRYYSYIRFYPDYTVITLSSISTPEKVATLFKKEHVFEDMGTGYYTIDEEAKIIKFASQSTPGTVNCTGDVNVDNSSISLEWHSQINGYSGSDEYNFVELPSFLLCSD